MTKPRTPVLNFLVKSKVDTKLFTKTQRYFFVMLHVIFALDFGFIQFKSPRNKVVMKLITFAQSSAVFICLTFIIFSNEGNRYVVWYLMDILLFYIFSLTLIVSKSSYYDYINDLHSFDSEIEIDSFTYRVEYKLIIWFLLNAGYRTMISFAYCLIYLEYCTFPPESLVLYNIAVIGLDTVLIVYTCVFYTAYLRLKRFTSFIKNDGKDVISCQYIYKSLVEIIERTKKSFDVVIILTLVTNTIDVTVTTYFPFTEEPDAVKDQFLEGLRTASDPLPIRIRERNQKPRRYSNTQTPDNIEKLFFYIDQPVIEPGTSEIQDTKSNMLSSRQQSSSNRNNKNNINAAYLTLPLAQQRVPFFVTLMLFAAFPRVARVVQDPLNMSVAYAIVAQELLLLFSPAFTAGLLAGQAEKLRLVLYDKLIKDKNQTKDIKRFVSYIDGRPLRFRVWRVVPLDWRLPIIVINISVTYLIVMIQFTHKY